MSGGPQIELRYDLKICAMKAFGQNRHDLCRSLIQLLVENYGDTEPLIELLLYDTIKVISGMTHVDDIWKLNTQWAYLCLMHEQRVCGSDKVVNDNLVMKRIAEDEFSIVFFSTRHGTRLILSEERIDAVSALTKAYLGADECCFKYAPTIQAPNSR